MYAGKRGTLVKQVIAGTYPQYGVGEGVAVSPFYTMEAKLFLV